MRALITGANGFVAGHLLTELRSHDPELEIWGLTWGEFDRAALEAVASGIRLVEGDLLEPGSIPSLLETARPDVLYHLAAASSVARSWDNAAQALAINAIGTAHLFDAILRSGLDPVVVVSSTAEVYGRLDRAAGPVRESAPLAPVSPYGTSKAAQDWLTAQYHRGRNLAAVRVRFFHLTGPGRPATFVASSFARQIARIELGLAPPRLAVGNLDAVRDITDVRDAVRACRMSCDRRHVGEVFNVCSGRGIAISDLVGTLLQLTDRPIDVEVDPTRMRPSDLPWMVGDPSTIEAATGWRAEIPLRETLSDLLDWWRGKLRAEA
jgi:GDP-4-dehydro-6-deoxy-D-mannose reductase